MEEQPKEEEKKTEQNTQENKEEEKSPEEKVEEKKEEEKKEEEKKEELKKEEVKATEEKVEEKKDEEKVEEKKEEEKKEEENNKEQIIEEPKEENQNNDLQENQAQTEEEKNIDEQIERLAKEGEEKEKLEKERLEKERQEKEEQERIQKEKEEKEKEEKAKKTFEKCLWNKYDYLNKRYKTKIECFENAIDIFTRLMSTLKDVHKVLNTIIGKNYTLFPGADYTQTTALNLIKKGIELNFNQITSTIDLLKKNLIEQFKRHKDEVKTKEKDAYNQFIKVINKYIDSRTTLEKNKNKYHQSVKVAELALKNTKSMEVKNIDNSQESKVTIQKLDAKAKELLNEAKKNYDKYLISLKETNKNREESINKQIQLIKLFESFEEKDGELITNLMKDIYNRQKEENDAQKNHLDEMDKAIKSIDIQKDNLTLINAYNSEDKPDEEITLIQYKPETDFEKASTPDEYKINHEVIKSLKAVIPDILPNFDTEKENQKQEMRELSKKIFVTNKPFTSEEKNKLMEYLTQKWSQTYFLIYLSKQRTNGRFARTQKLVNDLAEILNLILKSAEKEKDYHAAKNCMILSQTFYYDEKDKEGHTKKKYLLEFILNYAWLRTPGFWRGIIEEMIKSEAEKYMILNPTETSIFDKNDKGSVEKLSNICFSQILPYANNMKEFFMDDRFILKIVDEFIEKYHVQKELANTIYAGVISDKPEEIEKMRKEYKDNPNFENELMTLEQVKKQKGIA